MPLLQVPSTTGTIPPPRFGCSLAVYDNKLWVMGGGYGRDLARSGYDYADLYALDLDTWEWKQVQMNSGPQDLRVLGRCHAYCLVGKKLVIFGGGIELGNTVSFLDLESLTWGEPYIMDGHPPDKRMSAVMGLAGTEVGVRGLGVKWAV